MINKVPKEELNALFREIYSIENTANSFKESKKINPLYIFYGYKFKLMLNSYIMDNNHVPVFIKDFNVNYYENKPKKVYSGYSLEKKYRIFFDIEDPNLDDINNEITNSFELFNSVTEKFSNFIISQINLKAEKIPHPYTYFYSDNVIEFEFDMYITDKNAKFKIYLDEDLLLSEAISKWIISKPTSNEKEKINKLKRKIKIDVQLTSKPISISKNKNLIKNINFDIKIL